jgi:4-hydroxy-3-methylbut-2-en-1-yl diphosphate reductase
VKVIRARNMGFCFGVRDALAATEAIARPAEVTIYGELVHNGQINRRLKDRGFLKLPERMREADAPTESLLVTAHGISERRRRRLLEAGKTLIDTTCPLVRNAHSAARGLRDERWFVVVIGRRDHVEVRGIVEDLADFAVVERESDVVSWPAERIGVIAQTTTPTWQAERILRLIRYENAGREVRFVDTICRPTKERQEAVAELSREVRHLVVVGGKSSNNTRQLAALGESLGMTVRTVETASDLRPEWFLGLEHVGLTAGTSTPDDLIAEVERALRAMGVTESRAAVA